MKKPSKHVCDESLNRAVDECKERGNMVHSGWAIDAEREEKMPPCTFCGAPTEEIYVDHVIDEKVGAIAGGHSEIRCTKCGKEQGEDDVQPPRHDEKSLKESIIDAVAHEAMMDMLAFGIAVALFICLVTGAVYVVQNFPIFQ